MASADHVAVSSSTISTRNDDNVGANVKDSVAAPPRPPRLELEYETYFFQFSPKSFIDTIYNIFQDAFEERFEKLKAELIKKFEGELLEDDIIQRVEEMHSSVLFTFEENFTEFEEYAFKNIFHIPNFVLCPEHQIYESEQNMSCTRLDEDKLAKEVKDLENRAKSLKFVNECLKRELKELEFVRKYQESLMTNLTELAEELNRKATGNSDREEKIERFFNLLQQTTKC